MMPLVEDVMLFDIRDQIFTTGTGEDGKAVAANVSTKTQLLNVHDGTFFFANDVLHKYERGGSGGAERSASAMRLPAGMRPPHPDHQASGGVQTSTAPASDECELRFIIRLSQRSS